MSLFLSPVCNDQTFDVNGDPLTGGQVETYIAGSSTPAATYTSEAGTVPHSNPIILNSLGYAPSAVWLNSGAAYKFVVKDANGITLRTIDNVRGVNDSSVSVSEWVDSGFVPTYISATSFSVPGDQTAVLQVGRRLRTTNTSGTIYSGIQTATFGTGTTTVTVLNDSGTLDAGLSSVQYGLISADNTSFPFATFAAANTVAVVDDSASAGVHYPLFADGTAGQEAPKTSTAKLKYTPSTGRLEATQLKGDGSQLTAVPAAQLTGDVAQARLTAAFNAMSLGWGQTWQDVLTTPGRAHSTSYQNTTGRPIQVAVSADASDNSRPFQVSSDNSTWVSVGRFAEGTGLRESNIFAVIPVGWYYRINGAASITQWAELR
jgi:hypothetical protein